MMIKKPPIHSEYETADYCNYEFDPQADFSLFLTEARKHACQADFDAAPVCSEEAGKKHLVKDKQSKKSWKSSLFSWLKAEKKSRATMEQPDKIHISKPRGGWFSGPIHSGRDGVATWPRRQISGPLANRFNPSKRVQNEIPYTCLDQLTNPPPCIQSYGPVYLVT